jgi:hypothetical protein
VTLFVALVVFGVAAAPASLALIWRAVVVHLHERRRARQRRRGRLEIAPALRRSVR